MTFENECVCVHVCIYCALKGDMKRAWKEEIREWKTKDKGKEGRERGGEGKRVKERGEGDRRRRKRLRETKIGCMCFRIKGCCHGNRSHPL